MAPLTTARSLFEALDRRGTDPEAQRVFDDAVWAEKGVEASVLVTDLSGFTRLTQAYGILHFLSIFRRFTACATPLFEAHHGRLVRHEADDLIGMFDSPRHAIECAIAMMERVTEVNQELAEPDRIGLSIGIEHGRFLAFEDDVYGDPVNLAYKLGEDIAERDELLIGRAAFDLAAKEGLDLRGRVSPLRRHEVSKVAIEHYSMQFNTDAKK
jgi:class 3 adenylate cyclase